MTSFDLRAAFERAQAKWPSVALDFEPFATFMAPLSSGGALAVEDLALVDACCRNVAGAHQALEALLRIQARAIAHQRGASQVDEIVQRLLEKLLVGPSPRLATFSGRGALAAWLRAAALREALNLERARKQVHPDSDLERMTLMQTPVDLQVLQAHHANEFKAAFRSALTTLTEQQRELLRLHVVENLSLSEISRRWSVHRVTLARWLEVSRHHIALSTREHLNHSLRLSAQEYESLVGFLRTQVDVSLTGLGPK